MFANTLRTDKSSWNSYCLWHDRESCGRLLAVRVCLDRKTNGPSNAGAVLVTRFCGYSLFWPNSCMSSVNMLMKLR